MEIITILFQLLEDNVPVDCKDIIEDLKRNFLRDVRDLGLIETLKKWTKNEDDVEIIFS